MAQAHDLRGYVAGHHGECRCAVHHHRHGAGLDPKISEDGWITMDISPVITRLVDTVSSGGNNPSTAPEVDIKRTSSLVRIRENTTVVIGGLIQNEKHKTTRKVPILGDIPILGYPFRGVFENKRRTELVVFITPTIVR